MSRFITHLYHINIRQTHLRGFTARAINHLLSGMNLKVSPMNSAYIYQFSWHMSYVPCIFPENISLNLPSGRNHDKPRYCHHHDGLPISHDIPKDFANPWVAFLTNVWWLCTYQISYHQKCITLWLEEILQLVDGKPPVTIGKLHKVTIWCRIS